MLRIPACYSSGVMAPATLSRILQILKEHGVLLQQDKVLPNVVTLVSGEALSTSWWSHPRAQEIFRLLTELSDHQDVLFTKLLDGKVTLVHRRLWPSFLAVAGAREPWQLAGLSVNARKLLNLVEEGNSPHSKGPVVKELEKRILVHAEEVHTESGRHEILLESWKNWAKRMRSKRDRSVPSARKTLEDVVAAYGAPLDLLPWHRFAPA